MSDTSFAASEAQPSSDVFSPKAPAIDLPSGGGAIHGMGEKFSANPVTGTGGMSVPIAVTPGRSGFDPGLSLNYDSGAGNGPFGFGWRLSTPSITRRTDKGLPRYLDEDESDVFILSDTEDLVPVLVEQDGQLVREQAERDEGGVRYRVRRYRPRIEGLFSRIERWTDCASGISHWRTIGKDNVTTVFGLRHDARIADPHDATRIFSWLVSESYDDKGNAIAYGYRCEDGANLPDTAAERKRLAQGGFAQRYLKHIRYGNRRPRERGEDLSQRDDWLFELVLDYGEHDADAPTTQPVRAWPARPDAFSQHRATFELRTYRLCRRVLMFHHFADELGTRDYLVRSIDLQYREQTHASCLVGIEQAGYLRQDDGNYLRQAVPPLVLGYSEAAVDATVREVGGAPVAGIDGHHRRWVDLDGEGIPGVLSEQCGAWYYQRNLGNGMLAPAECTLDQPSLAQLCKGRQQLTDLAGSGRLDLVQYDGPMAGFYERTAEGGWQRFRAFRSMPTIDTADPNLRFIDLTGDGHADVLISDDAVFTWHAAHPHDGLGAGQRTRQAWDEEDGPRLVFANPAETLFLADMTGDGLTDIVRIRYDEVCYWPNLGYGRFGPKVAMEDAPVLDHPEAFDPRKVRLADIDGSGCTDLIYLGQTGVALYFNQSGNGWSAAQRLPGFPPIDDAGEVAVADLLGKGTACLVWSSPLPVDAARPLRYVDLMGGAKPYLLVYTNNQLGVETHVRYAASTEYYLRDRAEGRPWLTRLPFPVQVVERSEVRDLVSQTRLVSRYRYRHGYYDGVEREFRGFAYIERHDAEALTGDFDLPPVLTKTWLHTGAPFDGGWLEHRLRAEFFGGDAQAVTLPAATIPPGLSDEERREAARALKGSVLRQEVYADDGSERAALPYGVSESGYRLVCLQGRGPNRHAVFLSYAGESLDYQYERHAHDPRLIHKLTLAVDDYGNALSTLSVGYRRRQPAIDAQAQSLATLMEAHYTHAVDTPDAYRAPLIAESRRYQLTAPALDTASPLHFDSLRALAARASPLPYDAAPTAGSVQKRLLERTRTYYRRDDLDGALPLGQLEPLAIIERSHRLAFTPGLLTHYRDKLNADALAALLTGPEGRYADLDGDGELWTTSGYNRYSPDPAHGPGQELAYARRHFFLPQRSIDPYGNTSHARYDARYTLLLVGTQDALGNETQADYDLRVLRPHTVTDPNGNRVAVRFDALGRVVGTAVCGKAGQGEGDSFDDFGISIDPAQVDALRQAHDPFELAATCLGSATTRVVYDLNRLPVCSITIARETHVADLAPRQASKLRLSYAYSDGFGRQAQLKVQAEPGPLNPNDPDSPMLAPRWVGSGATRYNNKGLALRQYEPFFSATQAFGVEMHGVSDTVFYDPLGRSVGRLHPNHTYEKTVFDPWQQAAWDVNDTVALLDPADDPDLGAHFARLPEWDYLPTWYEQRIGGELGPHERTAAERAAVHAGTPAVRHLDTLGRNVRTVADNGDAGRYTTRVEIDIDGQQRTMYDALGRLAVSYDYDMLGRRIGQASMDAGRRWLLQGLDGNPLRAWDDRGHAFRSEYDALRRPLRQYVQGSGAESDPRTLGRDTLVEMSEYGESLPDATARNLRTRTWKQYDAAGIVTSERFDFKGNLLASTQQLLDDAVGLPDWSRVGERFGSSTVYDALNRPIQMVTPHSDRPGATYHAMRPGYNEANLLARIDTWLGLADAPNGLLDEASASERPVERIDYDAKGQRTAIVLGNGAVSHYAYDPLTWRLQRLVTRKGSERLQDLAYVYDPAGNISHIADDAQQARYFDGAIAQPGHDYLYDPLYRLIAADGREFRQPGHQSAPARADDAARIGQPWPGDPSAIGPYAEHYRYDAVGGLLEVLHRHGSLAGAPGQVLWKRRYGYGDASLLEPSQVNNRLSRSEVGEQTEYYRYDRHGNTVAMPQSSALAWDFKDQLHASSRQAGAGETTHYVYAAGGARIRKVTLRANGTRSHERIYLGGFELYREYDGSGKAVALERETLHIMDGERRIALIERKTIAPHDDESPSLLLRYQFGDHLGSASLELDETARVVSYEEYYPYGSTAYQALNRSVKAAAKRYRYTSMERDEETGFNYHRARYYLPWLGRWLSCDPLGVQGGIDLYAYGNGNPVVNTDTGGTQCDPEVSSCMDTEDGPVNFTAGEYRRVSYQLHVDEIDAVRGDLAGGVAGSPSDPDNKQLLDCRTNSQSKSNFVSSSQPPRRPPVSLVDEPDEAALRLTSGRLSEIDEIRDMADEATAATRAGARTNSGLRYRIARDPQTGQFLQSQGINPENLTLENPQGVSQFPTGSSVNFSPVDADIDPATGQVVPGPNTSAAAARRAASQMQSQIAHAAETEVIEMESHIGTPPTPNPAAMFEDAATHVGTTFVPGVGESLIATETIGNVAVCYGLPRLGAAALAGARAPGPAIVGGVVGAPAGYLFEGAARDAGMGDTASIGIGTAGAVTVGAGVAVGAVLLVATAPVSVPVLAGAAIVGGLAAGFGYLMSHM